MALDVEGGDIVVATGAIRVEGTSANTHRSSSRQSQTFTVTNALVQAAKNLGKKWHAGGTVQGFLLRPARPEQMLVGDELLKKWMHG